MTAPGKWESTVLTKRLTLKLRQYKRAKKVKAMIKTADLESAISYLKSINFQVTDRASLNEEVIRLRHQVISLRGDLANSKAEVARLRFMEHNSSLIEKLEYYKRSCQQLNEVVETIQGLAARKKL